MRLDCTDQIPTSHAIPTDHLTSKVDGNFLCQCHFEAMLSHELIAAYSLPSVSQSHWRTMYRSAAPVDDEPVHQEAITTDAEKHAVPQNATSGHGSDSDDSSIDKDLQDGVHRVEAVTSVWSFKTLVLAYCM